jgi:2-polyprenyl-6-methoxyphenol hydroxylase-like FAD-dependent oxidoreductase
MFGSHAVAAQPQGRLHFADGGWVDADLVVAADGIHSPIRDGLGLLRWRHEVGRFGYRAMIRRESGELKSEVGRTIAKTGMVRAGCSTRRALRTSPMCS